MSCIEMSRDLSERIRGQIIALSNEGMSQRKIADKVSQKVLIRQSMQSLVKIPYGMPLISAGIT